MTSLVHHQSCESVHSSLDLFSVPPTQTALEEGQYIEHHPLATLAVGAPIEFSVQTTGEYIDLARVHLHIKAKITKPDGSAFAAGEDVAPVNNWLHSLFSQVDVSLNDTLITPSENTYPYRAYFEKLLSYGQEAKESHLTTSLFYRDGINHMDDTAGTDNIGRSVRQKLSAEGKTVDLYGRLHADIFHQHRYLLNGVNMKLRLIPSKSTFNLIAHSDDANPIAPRSLITHASLFVRKVRLNPALELAHEKALQQGTAKYPIKRVNLKTFSISQGSLGCVKDNLYLGQLPTRLIVGLVDSTAFNGSYSKNPFNFKTQNITYMSLHVQGRQIPSTPLTPQFDQDSYVRAYHGLMEATGVSDTDSGNYLNFII